MARNLDLHIAALIFMSGTQALVSGFDEQGDVATTSALALEEEDSADPIPAPRLLIQPLTLLIEQS